MQENNAIGKIDKNKKIFCAFFPFKHANVKKKFAFHIDKCAVWCYNIAENIVFGAGFDSLPAVKVCEHWHDPVKFRNRQ